MNNVTLLKHTKELNLSIVWPRPEGNLGKCGSIVVMENNEISLRSSPCQSMSMRFICTYGK